MRICWGICFAFIFNLCLGQVGKAQDSPAKLVAPANWKSETIKLPPGFAPSMKLKGAEHVRFAPGMFKANSDSFFSYVFAFEIEKGTKLDAASLKRELLAYYRGLSKAVLGDKAKDVDFSKFQLELKKSKQKPANKLVTTMIGKLEWVEPFTTKSKQTLHLELQSWHHKDHEVVFVCVSPTEMQNANEKIPAIWQQMRKIRSGYATKKSPVAAQSGN